MYVSRTYVQVRVFFFSTLTKVDVRAGYTPALTYVHI